MFRACNLIRNRSLRLLAAAFVALCLAVTARPLAAAPRISAIDVTGAARISAETVRHYLKLKAGDAYDRASIDAALKRLFATGQFADVRISLKGSRLVVAVSELPVTASVKVSGNSAVDTEAVKKAAALKLGAPYSGATGHAATASVRALYKSKGYEDAAVDVRATPQGPGRVDVSIDVREGSRIKIGRVVFTGNKAFPSGT
ncbi:MAG: POTRA domain-containing protein, partial [Hyphomicrobiaceae bacterium]